MPYFFVSLRKALRIFRLIDAAVFTAIPVLGIFFAMQLMQINHIDYLKLVLYIFAVYLLAMHVFLINDWADYYHDKNDANKIRHQGLVKGLSSGTLLILAMITVLFSLALLLYFSLQAFLTGSALVVLSLLYSTSSFYLHGKAVPVLASLLHLSGGLLAFILGYLFYGQYHSGVLLAGLMFGVFLSAGHLFQEIQDAQGDKANKIPTIANTLGKRVSAILGLCLFFLGHAFFEYLIYLDFFPCLTIVNWAAFVLVAFFIGISVKNDLKLKSIIQLRNRYRVVYALFGIYILVKIISHIQ